ncbi:hypothetical protein B0H17DRAFT_669993 [Mycena rosella]|uniref:DUF6697 domain-containing protein n=1 Tax=Mycena rosella TaxID=1033263 RepID=A0AAD7GUH9_MYCRO|nr:hypothetical protein B0H17DRAFT_669993 [Mycena rosella]
MVDVKSPDDPSGGESLKSLSPENVERKATVKAELPPKVEASSTSEVAMLKALLAQRSAEYSKREVELRTQIFGVENQNKRLKLKRAADAKRIEALEAELARLKKSPDKDEKIEDSEDEGEQNETPSDPHTRLPPSSLTPPSMSPVADPPRSERPSRDAWRSLTPESSHGRSTSQDRNTGADVVAKDEVIDVIIKTEGEPDQFKRVTLIKSEDGNFDIWNVDGFGLGPTVEVDEKYNRGFTRKAFGGGHVVCYHHWEPKVGQETKTPFLTFNRSWNNALPEHPGMHGMGFFGMSGCPVKPQPLNFFVGEGTNDWRLSGTYNYTRWGEIAPHHISLLPPLVLDNWVHGLLSSQWGKSSIDDANETLKQARKVKFTTESVVEALHDGRLGIPFTILQCVGYPKEWFERLIYYEKHPKPKTKKAGKRRGPKAQGSPKKQAKTLQKGKHSVKREEEAEDETEDEDEDEDAWDASSQVGRDWDDGDSEHNNGPRRIAALPTRTSPRKLPRAMSVEL